MAAARRLSEELGGTDNDVKGYFFSLNAADLRPILDEYEQLYGRGRRVYAQNTIEAWRSGKRRMGGEVAERLFRILPKYMPLESKYVLVEKLWEKCRTSSEVNVWFGPMVAARDIRSVLHGHFEETIRPHHVPDTLQRRFEWLSAGDSVTYQQLLNHFVAQDVEEAVEIVTAEVLAVLREMLLRPGTIQEYRRTLVIGKHKANVIFAEHATEVALTRPGEQPYTATTSAALPSLLGSDDVLEQLLHGILTGAAGVGRWFKSLSDAGVILLLASLAAIAFYFIVTFIPR